MSLSPENEALIAQVFGSLISYDRGLADDEMNMLLDAAREEGRAEGRLESADTINYLSYCEDKP